MATGNPQSRGLAQPLIRASRPPQPSCRCFDLVSLSLTGPERVSAVLLKPTKLVTTFTAVLITTLRGAYVPGKRPDSW